VTAAGLGLAFGLRYVPIPGVDIGALPGTTGAALDLGLWRVQLSVIALGLVPFIAATQLVELVALAVPRLRPLRVGGPVPRARLYRASLALAVILAAIQAFFVATWLLGSSMESYSYSFSPVVPEPGGWFRLTAVLTLVAGTALLIAIAHLLSVYGLGNGFSLLIGWGLITELFGDGLIFLHKIKVGSASPFDLVVWIGAMVALGYATARVVAHAPRLTASTDEPPGFGVRLPTCGIIPLTVAASLMMLPAQLSSFGLLEDAAARLTPGSTGYLLVFVALVAAGGYLLSLVFYRTAAVARFSGAATTAPIRAAVRQGTLISLAFLCAALLAAHFLTRHQIALPVDAVVILTLIALDLRAECRWLRECPGAVKVWELHRLYAIDPLLRKLDSLGIAAHARAQHHRAALYFFGPYLPVELTVAPEQAGQALECVERELRTGSSEG